jgi:hypothetical protein
LSVRVDQPGLEFFDLDPRGSVPAKDANGDTSNLWKYRRQWIDRVASFFVSIFDQHSGQRAEQKELLGSRRSLNGAYGFRT